MSRIANEIAKLKRQRLLVERLNKVHSKRMLKEGYSLEEIQRELSDLIVLFSKSWPNDDD